MRKIRERYQATKWWEDAVWYLNKVLILLIALVGIWSWWGLSAASAVIGGQP